MKLFSKITRWSEMASRDVCNLLSWLSHSKSAFEFQNPNVLVAKATNECGDVVAYTAAEPVYVVSGFAVSPSATPEQAALAGDVMDAALVCEIQQSGCSRVLLVLPENTPCQPDEKSIRIIERKIPPTIA